MVLPLLASLDVPVLSCAEVGPAVDVVLAIVDSLEFFLRLESLMLPPFLLLLTSLLLLVFSTLLVSCYC
jgi:hypothetical protein